MELLLNIIEHPESTQRRLREQSTSLNPPSHGTLGGWFELGIVTRRQEGRVVTYSVVGGAEIATFIKTYHPTVWERWSSRLADIFIAYSAEEGKK